LKYSGQISWSSKDFYEVGRAIREQLYSFFCILNTSLSDIKITILYSSKKISSNVVVQIKVTWKLKNK
jgi:hypothetical protein